VRSLRYPKPKREAKVLKPIRRGTLPKARVPARHGDYRARYNYGLKLWARLVKAKEPSGVCPRCLKRPWVESAHCWIKGAYRSLALDLDNGAPLCRSCHRKIDSDHYAKERFFTAYIGPDRYERLRLLAITRSKMDLDLTLLLLEARERELKP
jgi:hypothetical protein